MTIITAKEARELTGRSKQMQERMDNINAIISKAAVMGNYRCDAVIEEELSTEDARAISSVLTEMGYHVGSVLPKTFAKEGDVRPVKAIVFAISWKEE